jgi:hypothetical protein
LEDERGVLDAAGVGSSATGMKKPSSPPLESMLLEPGRMTELRLFRYDAGGRPSPSFAPLSDGRSGDLEGLELPLEDDSFL